MSARFTPLFVCDNPAACSVFCDYLRDTGLRVLAAHDTGSAVMCSYTEPVDGILIYQEDVWLGSIIGRDFKSLFPDTPVVLMSTGFETMAPSSGIDAVCYTGSLDDEMAGVIAMVFRELLTRQPHPATDSPGHVHVDEHPRPFLVLGRAIPGGPLKIPDGQTPLRIGDQLHTACV
jgi:hypothetical protein